LYSCIWNEASTTHFLLGSRSEDKSALLPKTSDRPPSKIDFPAPVSPVIQVMPEEKEASSSSMSAKFFIVSCFNKALGIINLKK
jgi:hypothetical protein